TQPTPGNNNGSFEIHFNHVPSGFTRTFGGPGGGGVTTDSVFTGLSAGLYVYAIYDNTSSVSFEVQIILGSVSGSPCYPFTTDFETTETTISGHSTSGCDGSLVIESVGAPLDEYISSVFYPDGLGSGESFVIPGDTTDSTGTGPCYGVYLITTYNGTVANQGTNKYFTQRIAFIHHDEDVINYWNFPDTIPPGTDTVILDALHLPQLNYGIPPDTVMITDTELIGGDQYQLTLDIVQSSDTFRLYETSYLDTTLNYVFEITLYEGDSLLEDVANSSWNMIYFNWPIPPCDSVEICHVPPGNPNNAHTILVPCEDVGDHVGNHAYDYLGPCNHQMQQPGIFYVPGETEDNEHAGHKHKTNTAVQLKNLRIYPNPFEQMLQIQCSVVISHVEMYGMDGKLITSQAVNATSTTLNVKQIQPSAYFIKVYYADGSADMKKLVKIK
ncbi:MAG: T9SS type A sorting domain-containing protein, partial [Flavobacteriales bacterium]